MKRFAGWTFRFWPRRAKIRECLRLDRKTSARVWPTTRDDEFYTNGCVTPCSLGYGRGQSRSCTSRLSFAAFPRDRVGKTTLGILRAVTWRGEKKKKKKKTGYGRETRERDLDFPAMRNNRIRRRLSLVPCASPCAWGLPKYQSHARLQIMFVYIALAFHPKVYLKSDIFAHVHLAELEARDGW